jgi:type VI secretion system protein ImpK
MQEDVDPFRQAEEPDRTVFMPTPGGRRRSGSAPGAEAALPERGANPAWVGLPGASPKAFGANGLLAEAAPILTLVRQLQQVRRHDDVAGLRDEVIAAIRTYEKNVRRADIDPRSAARACYALCGLIDEAVLNTPWGAESIWSKQSLLITLYKEYSAGETFFRILQDAERAPKENLNLLELLFVCLSLGFQGRYRLAANGGERLAQIREETYALIRQHRAEYERELSPKWRGVEDRQRKVARVVPLWVAAAVAAALVLFAFFSFSMKLTEETDPVYAKMKNLVPATVVLPHAGPPSLPQLGGEPAFIAKLRTLLAPEIAAGVVDVREQGAAAQIVFFSKELFPSGGAEIAASFRPVLARLGTFLSGYSMPVTILGHTDNVPIRTVRFPSNFHLSKARAQSVANVLSPEMAAPARLRVDGRADLEPVADNSTADGRALNRRVEIRVPLP